jgi:putative addiction module component (TIGR02574 family)
MRANANDDAVAEAPPLTAAQRDELERRWQALQQNPDQGEDWDDVRAELLND